MCIFEWYKVKDVCPVCRSEIGKIGYNIQPGGKHGEMSCVGLDYRSSSDDFHRENARSLAHITIRRHTEGFIWMSEGSLAALGSSPTNRNFGSLQNSTVGPSYCLRYISVTLTQMLATLFEKYPDLGFPSSRIDFQTFRSAINFPVNDDLVPDYFRCFVYMHDYVPVNNFERHRQCDLKFLQENPALLPRLITFIQNELAAFGKAFKSVRPINGTMMKDLLDALKVLDVQSAEFIRKLREIVFMFDAKLIDKLHQELVVFAKCPHSDYKAYVLNVQYQSTSSKMPSSPKIYTIGSDAASSSTFDSSTNTDPSSPSSSTLLSQGGQQSLSNSQSSSRVLDNECTANENDPDEGPSRPKIPRQESQTNSQNTVHQRVVNNLPQLQSTRLVHEVITLTSESESEDKATIVAKTEMPTSNPKVESSSSDVEFLCMCHCVI